MATAVQQIAISAGSKLAFARPVLRVVTLLGTDIASLSLAVLFAFWYWSIVNPLISQRHTAMYSVAALSVATFAFQGLYPGIGFNAVQHMRRMTHSINFVYLLLAASMVLLSCVTTMKVVPT